MLASPCNRLSLNFQTITRRNPTEKVKRSLFGPVDHEFNQKFINEHLRIDTTRYAMKYNFDFVNDRPLNSNGEYVWKEASPVNINRKRKPSVETNDAAAMYFQPIDATFKPIEPAMPSESKALKSTPKQSKITDFMPKSKRSGSSVKETSSEERPKKIPRLGECSS